MFIPSLLGFIVGVIIGLGRHPELYSCTNNIILSTPVLQ